MIFYCCTDSEKDSSRSSTPDSGFCAQYSGHSKMNSQLLNNHLASTDDLRRPQSCLKNDNYAGKEEQEMDKRTLSFQERISESSANRENKMMFDTNFMWSAPIEYKFNLGSKNL